ncbi:hypothetical protein QE152_g26554 [Popillia japonica]|uniref:Uncharacterized protein n=1 Tax=Popillia japonica TaxID=7064 RepID=A0AAW1JYC6_POPJA
MEDQLGMEGNEIPDRFAKRMERRVEGLSYSEQLGMEDQLGKEGNGIPDRFAKRMERRMEISASKLLRDPSLLLNMTPTGIDLPDSTHQSAHEIVGVEGLSYSEQLGMEDQVGKEGNGIPDRFAKRMERRMEISASKLLRDPSLLLSMTPTGINLPASNAIKSSNFI